MPTPTYTPIASVTLSSAQADVTFSSLSGYRDLIFVARNITSGTLGIRVNNDSTSSAYVSVRMTGDGSSVSSSTATNTYWSPAFYPDPGSGFFLMLQLFDYSQTATHKVGLTHSENAGNGVERWALRWQNTTAITSVKFFDNSGGNLNSGGTYAVYGVIA